MRRLATQWQRYGGALADAIVYFGVECLAAGLQEGVLLLFDVPDLQELVL
jgi:hypothetical protein